MKPADVQEDHVYLKAFPYSLESNAKDWLYYLAPTSITSWDDLKRLFLAKFFPASMTTTIRKEISGIKQQSGETLYEYWERFKNLCSSCPHHQISEHLLLQYIYEGLHHMDRNMIDAASGGALGNKTPVAARQLIENMASNSQQFGTRSDAIVVRGVHDVGVVEYTKSWRVRLMLLPHWSTNLLPIREPQLPEFMAFVHFLIISQTPAQHCNNMLLLLLHQWILLRRMQPIFSTTIGPNTSNKTMICQQINTIQDGGITLI